MAESRTITVGFDEESLVALRELKGKLDDETLRLEAMRLAVQNGRGRALDSEAGRIESYIRNGRQKDEQGFVSLAPECFIGADGAVIAFQGSNFYKACDNWVRRKSDGGSSHCVKRDGHDPKNGCEDWDGNIRRLGEGELS
jgi:hypothetical protein